MKKKLYIVSITLTFVFITLITVRVLHRRNTDKIINIEGELPSLCISDYKGIEVCLDTIAPQKNIILLFANPECGDCINIIPLINNNVDFSETRLLIVVQQHSPDLDKMVDDYELMKSNVILLVDTLGLLFSKYEISSVPQTFIFNKHHQIEKRMSGEFSLSYLKRFVKIVGEKE